MSNIDKRLIALQAEKSIVKRTIPHNIMKPVSLPDKSKLLLWVTYAFWARDPISWKADCSSYVCYLWEIIWLVWKRFKFAYNCEDLAKLLNVRSNSKNIAKGRFGDLIFFEEWWKLTHIAVFIEKLEKDTYNILDASSWNWVSIRTITNEKIYKYLVLPRKEYLRYNYRKKQITLRSILWYGKYQLKRSRLVHKKP